MYKVEKVGFDDIYHIWQEALWPGRDVINKISTFTIKDNNFVQQTNIKRYENTVVFFGLKYTSHYYEEKEELVDYHLEFIGVCIQKKHIIN